MNATVMAIILVLIVVATVVTKKVPFNFVLFIVPIICSLLLGFSLQETSDFVLEQFSSIMKSAGFMLLFAFLYFQNAYRVCRQRQCAVGVFRFQWGLDYLAVLPGNGPLDFQHTTVEVDVCPFQSQQFPTA